MLSYRLQKNTLETLCDHDKTSPAALDKYSKYAPDGGAKAWSVILG